MRKTVQQAARATVQLAMAAALAFGSYLFITVLHVTAAATVLVVGAGLLPETVLLVRRIAGAKRRRIVTERAVSKHIGNVFLKLGLPPSDSGHRRVLAVLAYVDNS
jgi:hypothetical protein